MNANTVNGLRCELYKRQTEMDISEPERMRINSALKCVDGIETPFSLQGLSRLAIRSALSTGILNNESLANNNIPVHVKEYILNQD